MTPTLGNAGVSPWSRPTPGGNGAAAEAAELVRRYGAHARRSSAAMRPLPITSLIRNKRTFSAHRELNVMSCCKHFTRRTRLHACEATVWSTPARRTPFPPAGEQAVVAGQSVGHDPRRCRRRLGSNNPCGHHPVRPVRRDGARRHNRRIDRHRIRGFSALTPFRRQPMPLIQTKEFSWR